MREDPVRQVRPLHGRSYHPAKSGAADSAVSVSVIPSWWNQPASREENSGMQVGLSRQEEAGEGVEEEAGVIGAPGPSARAAPNVLGGLGSCA